MKGNFFILVLYVLLKSSYGQVETACLGVNYNYVRSSLGCNHWHFCINQEVNNSGICEDDTNFHVTGGCISKDLVDCTACSPHGIQHIQSTQSYSEYIECNNGIGTVRECAFGYYFNTGTGYCDLPTTTTTTTTELTTPTTTNSPTTIVDCSGIQVHHAHPHDCSKFFICFNKQAHLLQCPSDLHWNQFIITCDTQQNAGCVV